MCNAVPWIKKGGYLELIGSPWYYIIVLGMLKQPYYNFHILGETGRSSRWTVLFRKEDLNLSEIFHMSLGHCLRFKRLLSASLQEFHWSSMPQHWSAAYTLYNLQKIWCQIMVQVKDTGCGISPQDMPHTFTKFAHPQNGTNKLHNGNGLGLALSRRYTSKVLPFPNPFPLENIWFPTLI